MGMRRGPGGRSNWQHFQQQQQQQPQQRPSHGPPPPRGYAPRGPQAYYAPPPLPPPLPGAGPAAATPSGGPRSPSEVAVFVERFRASRSGPSAPPNALTLDVVVQAICAHFRVAAFEELLGVSALQLPALRQLHTVNQRVWTFVTCFTQSRRVNTLFECQQAFLQHEGVRDFAQLRLGNSFLHAEAVQTLYGQPRALLAVTTRDVLGHLRQFEALRGQDAFRASSHLDLREFLRFLAQQYGQPSAAAMGVAIDPAGFGVYVGMLRRVANHEMKELKALEHEFQRGVADKVFQLTKDKFSSENRQQALDELLAHTTSARDDARQAQDGTTAQEGWKTRRGGKKSGLQSLSLDVLQRVTDVDVYLDKVLRRKAAATQDKQRKPISSQEIAETDRKIRTQLTRFLAASQKSKHHSRLKVVTWVLCGIMAKTYALLLSDDKLPDESLAADADGQDDEDGQGDGDECDCCCVGKATCECRCSCSCHVDSSDEEDAEDAEDAADKEPAAGVPRAPRGVQGLASDPNETAEATAKTVAEEELKAEVERFLASQLSGQSEVRTGKDVLLLLSSLETHLTETFGGRRWEHEHSVLQLLARLLDAQDDDAGGSGGDHWLAQLTRSFGGERPHGGRALMLSDGDLREEVAAFVRECRAAISSSASLSTLSRDKQQLWLAQRLRVEFGCARVAELGLGGLDELVQLAEQSSSVADGGPASIVKHTSALDVEQDDVDPASDATDEAVDAQRKLRTEQALAQLRQCPCLVDVAQFLGWRERYAPLCGSLRAFLRANESLLVSDAAASSFLFVCCASGAVLRVNEASSASDLELLFSRASAAGSVVAPGQVAVHLASMLVTCSGRSNFPTQLVQAHLRGFFGRLVAESRVQEEDTEASKHDTLARFVLDVLLETPVELAGFVGSLLLDVAAQAAAKGRHTDVAAQAAGRVWEACRSDAERKALVLVCRQSSSPLWANQTHAWCERRHKATAGGLDASAAASASPAPATTRVSSVLSPTAPAAVQTSEEHDAEAIGRLFEASDASDAAWTDQEAARSSAEPHGGEDADAESCRAFIAQLRQRQFGVGLEVADEATTAVLRLQQQRLERALKRLSDELYSEKTHFVLELLQNADDNAYAVGVVPRGEFTLTAARELVFHNNERGFSPANVRAICDVGASTKPASASASIGKKGIGFKSVFKVSDAPQVHSNGFHIRFHVQDGGGMGYILPHWMADASRWRLERGTTFVLPLHDAAAARADDISRSLLAFEPSVLLFLRRMRELRLRDETRGQQLHFLKKERAVLGHPSDAQLVHLYSKRLRSKPQREGEGEGVAVTQQSWLVVRASLEPPPPFGRSQPTELALALPLAGQEDAAPTDRPALQQVFAYLPLRSYGLRFIVQGDFEVPSSREAITNGSEWNQWLVAQCPALVRSAVASYVAVVASSQRATHAQDADTDADEATLAAISHLLSLLPFENEVQAPFRHVVPQMMRELRLVRWLASSSSGDALWTPAELLDCAELARGDASGATATLLAALDQDTLVATFGKRFLHPRLSRSMAPMLKSQLRLEQLQASHLLRVLALSASRDDVRWTAKMLALLAKLWRRDRHAGLLRQELRLIKCFPLQQSVGASGSKWTSLAEAHDALFVPADASSSPPTRAYEFYADLRLLADEFTREVAQLPKLRAFLLQDVGIRVMADHDLMRHHLLPRMAALRSPAADSPDAAGPSSEADPDAVREYGRFLATHMASCAACPLQQDVKASLVVVTSTQRLVAVEEPGLLVVLPSAAVSMADLVVWAVAKLDEAQQNDTSACHLVSTAYFSSAGDGDAADGTWRRLLVDICGLPLLFDVARATPDARALAGMRQLLRWLEAEDDTDVKRRLSTRLARHLDEHWTEDTTEADVEAHDKPELALWREHAWLEGSDGQFHRPSELWLASEAATRLFPPATATFSSFAWTNERLSRDVLGLRSSPSASDVLRVLSRLSVDATLAPTLETDHMTRVYSFLWDESQRASAAREEIAQAFAHKTLLFVPSETQEDAQEDAAGRFVGVKSAVWLATAFNGDLVALASLYPKKLRAFFTDVAGVQRKPSVAFLCEMLADRQLQAVGQRAVASSGDSTAGKKRKAAWRRELLPILSALARQVRKGALGPDDLRVLRKTLKSSRWLPARRVTGGSGVVLCSSKERPVRAATESDRQLQKLLLSLAKDASPVKSSDATKEPSRGTDVKVTQLGDWVGDGELDALLDVAKLPTLSSHLEAHASAWCETLAQWARRLSAHDTTRRRKKLLKLMRCVVATWARAFAASTSSSSSALHHDKQFQWKAQHLLLFPTLDEDAPGRLHWAPASEMYLNDQTALPKSDFQRQDAGDRSLQRHDGLPVLALFPWEYFVADDEDADDSDVSAVRTFLLQFCGLKSLQTHLQHEVSVLSTHRSASTAFLAELRAGLGLAQRVLYHHHRRRYNQLSDDRMAALATQLQCVLVDGQDGFHVVYRVGDAFSLRRGAAGGCFLDVPSSTLYVQCLTGDEEASALLPVLMELCSKLFGRQVASSVANVLYLASLQGDPQARERWLVETQRLPPLLATDVSKLWVEPADLTSSAAETEPPSRKRSCASLEDGEVAGDDLPATKKPLDASLQQHESLTAHLAVNNETSAPPFPPLPPPHASGALDVPRNTTSMGFQPPYPPFGAPGGAAGNASPYPPLPPTPPPAGSQGLTLSNTMSKEEREAIGRWGEEYVFQQLRQQHASSSESQLTVEWVNEQEESGLPYDVTLSSNGKVVEYIEVKSTRTMEKAVFEISMNELDQAAVRGSSYSIYRVFNAGNAALCRVIRMKNPVALVRQRKIQLALVMQ